ncbi:D-glycerate dehydrogenase [Metallosphaera tengchongensis]|uniref:D-glycerate dehydrogenase n=1 Tax=Metallosphaera tengchongensis TaxID=1532350 RepID=A0A6N0NXF4_9CREN|nr:D-glycerate dehydrogenase [Metallosphaera tengchongensis]QKR00058.1 D-glycerate dehydrogenase [Metallosphaera tengchongensis]
MYKVLITRKLPGKWVHELSQEAEVELWEEDYPPPKSWIISRVADKEGILVTLTERVDREIIDSAKRLKVISTYSVGVDHIDVAYAKERNIKVTYTPEVLTDATADLIFGLLIAVARRIVEGDKVIRAGQWSLPWFPTYMLGKEVNHSTLGILGMGRIGQAVLKRAKGFDMRVIYHSRKRHEVEAEFVDLDTLLRESDFLVVTVDLNKETYHLLDYEKLSKLKRTAFLINASRGAVINQQDLVKILKENKIAGAALDVFEKEPIDKDDPLIQFPNVVLTPHLGSATVETRERMAEIAVKNLILSLKGERPLYEVT